MKERRGKARYMQSKEVSKEKAREFQKNTYFCFIDYAKALCGLQQTVENSLRDGDTRPPDLPPWEIYAD